MIVQETIDAVQIIEGDYEKKLNHQAGFRNLIERANHGILIIDRRGVVKVANRVAGNLLACSPESLCGFPFCLPVEAGLKCEMEMTDLDGSPLLISVEVSETVWEGEKALLTVLKDITGNRHTLQFSPLLETAVQSSPDAVIMVEAGIDKSHTKIIYVNPAFTKMTGYSAEEVLGQHPSLFNGPQFNLEEHRQLIEKLKKGESFFTEGSGFRKDGSEYPQEWYCTCIKNPAGAITHYVIVWKDISGRKRAEEALSRTQDQFRQAQRMEAVGRLAGGVAHDFNNLLTVIMGYTALLGLQLRPGDPLLDYVEQIEKVSQRASTLTRQLLAFSRRQVLQPKVLNLNEIVGNIDNMLRRLIGEDIDMVTALQPGLGAVLADAGQIEQVLMNLVVNSRDAMPRGGKLTIVTENVELSAEYASQHLAVAPGKYVMLAVSDTGFGMDHETQAHIFEPFFTTKDLGKGTGLGLSTVYGIVKQSGGNIWVYSEPGLGTTFKIYLPKVEDKGQKVEIAPASPMAKGNETVLLVEDEEVVRKLVKKILIGNGYQVLEATHGGEALQITKIYKEKIDLLLTDLVMPELNGREVSRRVRKQYPGIKVLCMSGYTDSAVMHQGTLPPETLFIQKPFTPEALLNRVREVLDGK